MITDEDLASLLKSYKPVIAYNWLSTQIYSAYLYVYVYEDVDVYVEKYASIHIRLNVDMTFHVLMRPSAAK